MKKWFVLFLVVVLSLLITATVTATEQVCTCPPTYTYLEGVCLDAAGSPTEIQPVCETAPIEGCTNPLANNYDPDAVEDDGSCLYTWCHVAGRADNPANYIQHTDMPEGAFLGHFDLQANPDAGHENDTLGLCDPPEPPPDPTVRFNTGCGDDCIPAFFVGFEPGTEGDALVITGPTGVTYSYTGAVETREQARPGTHTWIIYRNREPIMRGAFDVAVCECPADPYVTFRQGCVDGVPVIGIDFVGEEGDTLKITGNGRDLSYTPGVYRERMRPFDSYSWAIFQGESGFDKGTLLVEVCPVDPTPTPTPKKPPKTGGADDAIWLVAGLSVLGLGVGAYGVREFVRAKREED